MSEANPPAGRRLVQRHETDLRTIIVPVSKPETAYFMLALAVSFLRRDRQPNDATSDEANDAQKHTPEKGEASRVLALTIALDGSEATQKRVDDCTPVIQDYIDQGYAVEQVTEFATSVTRGILDAAREYRADLIILGTQRSERRQVELGDIVENVMEAAPCDVLIYRFSESPGFDRVLVPIDGTPQAVTALDMGVRLARRRQLELVVLYIQRDYLFVPEQEFAVRELLESFTGSVQKESVPGDNPASQTLNQVGENDMLIMGMGNKNDFERRLTDDLTSTLLNRSPGPVLLLSRVTASNRVQRAFQREVRRFKPLLTDVERIELVWRAHKQSAATIDYTTMILLSAGLATFGLLLNSPAVIIGAMLVAPLMQPLSGFAIGLTNTHGRLVRQAALTLIEGVALAVGIAFVIGNILPGDFVPTSEMTVRGNPSLLDAAVALIGGLAAAFATARKDVPATLAGVAIAAALMPPLSTLGLSLALQDWSLAGGAWLLFATNILFIVLAETAVFLWLGIRSREAPRAAMWSRAWWVTIFATVAVIGGLLFYLGQRPTEELTFAPYLRQTFAPLEFVDYEVREGEPPTIQVTVRSPHELSGADVRRYQAQVNETLDATYRLEVVVWRVIGAEITAEPLPQATPPAEATREAQP